MSKGAPVGKIVNGKLVMGKEPAAAGGYRVVEGAYAPEDLLTAGEAFLTNSLMEVMPLVIVDGNSIGDGKPERVTKDLLHRYRGLTLLAEP